MTGTLDFQLTWALARVLRVLGLAATCVPGKWGTRVINDLRHSIVRHYLYRTMSDLIADYRRMSPEPALETPPLAWVFWWQGFQATPPLVSMCRQKAELNLPTFDLVEVSQANYLEWVTLGPHATNAFEKGKFSLTHFSDLVRFNLLKNHGGVWIDSTLLFLRPLGVPAALGTITTRRSTSSPTHENVSLQRWASYLLGGPRNLLAWQFINDFFERYWERHDQLINYHLVDYAIDIAYRENFGGFADALDLVPESNAEIHSLLPRLSEKVSDTEWQGILEAKTGIFKLSWRWLGTSGIDHGESPTVAMRLGL